MNSKWVASFFEVVDAGSISAAARNLYISPQALTQQINLIEQETEIHLFDRDKSGCELTPEGKKFYDGLYRVAKIYQQTLDSCRKVNDSSDVIRLPIMSDFYIPYLVEDVVNRYQETEGALKVRMVPTQIQSSLWINGLCNHEFDIIGHYAIDGLVPEGIYFEKLKNVDVWCVVSKHHFLKNRQILFPHDLQNCQIVVPYLSLSRYFQLYLEATEIKADIYERPSNRFSIMEACDNGDVYILFRDVSEYFPNYKCIPLNFDFHVQRGIACHENIKEKVSPFFEIAHQVMAEQEEQKSKKQVKRTL